IQNSECVEKAEVAAPGFVNFFLSASRLQKETAMILGQKENYGSLDIGQKKKVQVEFISANPTGPLTLGNGRGGFMGDVLANILAKSGFEVEREYYVNDAGLQVGKLGHSIKKDELAEYKGKYIDALSYLAKNADEITVIGKAAADVILETMIKPTVEKGMKIKFDLWFRESELYKIDENTKIRQVDKIINFLKEKKLAYEKEGALWFKSTEFGDDKDRVLIKTDGEKTYLASDVAYLKNKSERGFEKLIYFWGADHHGYVQRYKAAGQALGFDSENIEIIIVQLVRLMKEGKEVRMSKRAGNYVTLDELIEEVGLDAARFFFLMHSAETHMDFDLDLAKEKSEKNPVYYVQYAHARISSIFRKAGQEPGNDFGLLKETAELNLIKQIARLPEIVEDSAKDYQVQRLPQFALDLVRSFHKFYEECRVIDEKNPELTAGRLGLIKAVQIVLKNTLDLMGISAPEKM
ncbi:MAG: arginine--tRNA ligase, partial [Candidatus Portnoybacteria bacterium]|nr:arginine--tRNA ligase [Candidatus Portnoybacteria bacterium]